MRLGRRRSGVCFRRGALSIAAALALLAPAAALAQPSDTRYAEEPTAGVHLPTAPLAGEHDATATTVNPAGLLFLEGPHLGLALNLGRDTVATTAGEGGGVYVGAPIGGGLLPRLAYGISFEWLSPPREELAPDPGSPTRLSMATALPLGENSALGFTWHHFYDDDGAPLDGTDTYDLGYSARFGAHWAAGFVVRDLTAPTCAARSGPGDCKSTAPTPSTPRTTRGATTALAWASSCRWGGWA